MRWYILQWPPSSRPGNSNIRHYTEKQVHKLEVFPLNGTFQARAPIGIPVFHLFSSRISYSFSVDRRTGISPASHLCRGCPICSERPKADTDSEGSYIGRGMIRARRF